MVSKCLAHGHSAAGVVDAESRTRSDVYFRQGAGPQVLARAQPQDARVSPEPRFLGAREAPRGAGGLVASLVQGQLAVEVAEHLLVTERAARGLAVAQAAGDQAPHLRLEAGCPHAVDAGLDPAVEFLAVHLDAELNRGAAAVVARHRGAERPARQFDDLEGADDPAAVARQDRVVRDGVLALQARIE